ncbi:MAG: LamG-like jellyroll fold domain-containing protein, partial [Elusimicrobiota bacterium]
ASTAYSYKVAAIDAAGNVSGQSASASATTSAAAPPPPPSTAPVGWWKLDEGSGASTLDASVNGNTATLFNSPAWTAGKLAGALNFDGVDDYVVAGVGGLPAVNAPQSISLWYRVAANAAGQNLVVLRAPSSSAANQVMLTANGMMAMTQWGGAVTVQAPAPAAGAWHLFTWTWDGATHRLYLDGSQAAAATTALQSGPVEQVYLGTYNGADELLSGTLDDVRVYNRALSAAEVQQLFNASAPPPADTTAPSVPTGLSASAVSASQINLSWTASTDNVGVAGYRIFRGGTQIATTASTSYSNSGLSASTAYSYTVAAYDAAGNVSAQSVAVSARTPAGSDTTAPGVPTGLTATAVSASRIDLRWNASTDNVGVAGYRIFRGTSPLSATTATAFSHTGLTASTTYTYTVSAYDAAGNSSAKSAAASARTLKNAAIRVMLARAPPAFGSDSLSQDSILSIKVDRASEPSFPLASTMMITLRLPSGDKTLVLAQVPSDSSSFFARLPQSEFPLADFFAL